MCIIIMDSSSIISQLNNNQLVGWFVYFFLEPGGLRGLPMSLPLSFTPTMHNWCHTHVVSPLPTALSNFPMIC